MDIDRFLEVAAGTEEIGRLLVLAAKAIEEDGAYDQLHTKVMEMDPEWARFCLFTAICYIFIKQRRGEIE